MGVEAAHLGGDALSDGREPCVSNEEAYFPQPSPTPPLAHHSHPFGGCGHFHLPG